MSVPRRRVIVNYLDKTENHRRAAASCLSRRSVSIVFANVYLLLSTMICSSAINSRNWRSTYARQTTNTDHTWQSRRWPHQQCQTPSKRRTNKRKTIEQMDRRQDSIFGAF